LRNTVKPVYDRIPAHAASPQNVNDKSALVEKTRK